MLAVMLVTIDSTSIALSLQAIPDIFSFYYTTSDLWNFQLYCIVCVIYSSGVVLGSIMLGTMSDYFGRVNALKLSLLGTVAGYTLFLIALHYKWLILLFIARLMTGFFSITCPLTQAVAIDNSPIDEKTFQLNWITLGYSAGFLLGPLLIKTTSLFRTSIITSNHLIITAILMCLLNLLLIYQREDKPISSTIKRQSFSSNIYHIWPILIMIAMNECAYGLFCQIVPSLLIYHHKFNLVDNSLFYGLLGLAHIMGVIYLQLNPNLIKKKSLLMRISVFFTIIAYSISYSFGTTSLLLATTIIGFLQVGICNILLEKASIHSQSNSQGQTMGICNTVIFMSYTLTSFIPLLYTAYSNHVLLICSILMAALFLYIQLSKHLHHLPIHHHGATQ